MKRGPTFILIVYFCVVAFAYWQVDILWSSTETISLENLDLYTLYYPIISYAIECLKVWHIPLWNPYQALGVPFAASAYYGMFYPLNFIYFILPVHIALGASTALHIAMAGLFTYIFLYHGLKISLQSALIGATVFMLSGAFTSEVAHPNDLNAMVWLPLILFHVENIFQTRKPLWGVLLGVTLGLQVLTMSFQTVIFSGYTIGAYSLFRLCLLYAEQREGIFLVTLYLTLGVFIALCLSSVQWLPTMEQSALSVRSTMGLSINDVEMSRELLTPFHIARGMVIRKVSLYIGIIPVLLSLTALFFRTLRPYTFFFLFWSIVTLILSFGTHWPLYNLYYDYVPTGDYFRVPLRFLWLSMFSISVLTGIGSETISKKLPEKGRLKTALLFILLFIITMDLFNANVHEQYHHPQKNPEIFQRHSEEGKFLRKNQGFYRTYISNQPWDFSMSHRFGSLQRVYVSTDYNPLTLAAYRDLVGAVLRKKRISNDNFFYGSYHLSTNRGSKRLMTLLSIGFVMEKGQKVFGGRLPPGMREIYSNKGVKIYRNKGALPRAYVVYNSETITGEDEALERVASPSFNPRSTVILDKETGIHKRQGPLLTKARITRFLPESIELTASLPQRGVLVLTDFFYPGWKAYVDGEERPIIRANTIMRGLVLEKGSHNVKFVYRPLPFRIGFWSCMLTLSGLIIYLGVDMKKRKRAGRPL